MLFESMDENSVPLNHAFAEWRVEQHPVLLDVAVLATPRGVPINDVARVVPWKHGMKAVQIEHVPSMRGAESQRLGLLLGTTLAT